MPLRSHPDQSTGSHDRQVGEPRQHLLGLVPVCSSHPGSRLRPGQRRRCIPVLSRPACRSQLRKLQRRRRSDRQARLGPSTCRASSSSLLCLPRPKSAAVEPPRRSNFSSAAGGSPCSRTIRPPTPRVRVLRLLSFPLPSCSPFRLFFRPLAFLRHPRPDIRGAV